MKYIIDSNCFIEPHQGYCPTDVAISFWSKLKELYERGILYSIDKVKDELFYHEDDLKNWFTNNMEKEFFIPFDGEETINQLIKVNKWAMASQQYKQSAKTKFTDVTKADMFLVAFASLNPNEWKIVSFERSEPNSQTNIKLPDACKAFGVSCIKLQDMFREIGETF